MVSHRLENEITESANLREKIGCLSTEPNDIHTTDSKQAKELSKKLKHLEKEKERAEQEAKKAQDKIERLKKSREEEMRKLKTKLQMENIDKLRKQEELREMERQFDSMRKRLAENDRANRRMAKTSARIQSFSVKEKVSMLEARAAQQIDLSVKALARPVSREYEDLYSNGVLNAALSSPDSPRKQKRRASFQNLQIFRRHEV